MKRVNVGELELAVVDEGNGPPLVLVHGFPLDHTMWNAQIDAFRSRYRVIAPDLRGFGQSDVSTETVTMDRFARDLHQMLQQLAVDPPVVLCGLSMGGYVALAFWRRFASSVRALILCDTRAAADDAAGVQARKQTADLVLAEGPGAIAEGMLVKLFAADAKPELVESTRQVMLETRRESMAGALHAMADRPDSVALLKSIDVPTLVVVGRDDAISTVGEMRAISENIAGARFIEVPNAGHMAPLENPSFVNREIDRFLSGLPGHVQ